MNNPFLLVDKSFLRAISFEESKALQKHYSLLLCPLLLEELISDFSDPKLSDENQLKTVIQTVSKANGIGVFTLHDARAMLNADISGFHFSLDTQIPRFQGKNVFGKDGTKGIVLEPTFEEKLLSQWSVGRFSKEDLKVSGRLKADFIKYDLPGSQEKMGNLFPKNKKFKTIKEIEEFVDENEDILGTDWNIIQSLLKWALMDDKHISKIKEQWEAAGKLSLKSYAPYAYYCHRVMSIYFLGVTANLISTGKSDKTLIDIFYFLYLPFAHEFVSGDKFHKEMFPYFARNNQGFKWAQDLKIDLKQISEFHKNMNETDRSEYEKSFGSYPPPIPNSLTQSVWLRHMGPWSPERFGNKAFRLSSEEQKNILEQIRKKTGIDF